MKLFKGSEIAGIDGIECKSFLFPVRHDRLDLAGQIMESESPEHRMCR